MAALPDSKDELLVEIGNIKVRVPLSDISKIDKNGVQKSFSNPNTFKKKGASGYSSMFSGKVMSVSPSINVIGCNLDDAVMEVEKYLDDAYMSGLKQVTVVHGRGTGTLKNGLRRMFRSHRLVDSFRSGSYDDGGEAVTVVNIKED